MALCCSAPPTPAGIAAAGAAAGGEGGLVMLRVMGEIAIQLKHLANEVRPCPLGLS